MTFSEKIKDEITHLKFQDNELKSLIFAFITNRIKININNNVQEWYLDSNFSFIARFLGNSIKKLFDIDTHFMYTEISNFNNKRTYRVLINDASFVNVVEQANEFYNKLYDNIDNEDQMIKRAYVCGAFLSGGSVSDIDKSIYHLEIRSSHNNYLRILQKILLSFKLSPTILNRNYLYVLYIKKSYEISDFLKIVGAMEAMYQLEDAINVRDFKNNLHRINNLDIANMAKTTKSSEIQVEQINKIINTKEFKKAPKKFQYFCLLRLEYPLLSLSGLAEKYYNKYKIKVTRAGLNHYVIKLKQMSK